MENKLNWLYRLLWLGLLALAVFLRVDNLTERPVHADEATGARILAQQLEGKDYAYNPRHFHGPILSQLAYPLARLRGENDWPSLSIGTLRSSTVIAGVLLVLTPLLWWRTLGRWTVLMAAAWLATSPLLVYYSRVYIHESWLALFGMLACAGLYRLTLRPTAGRALATGVMLGLMFATKITFVISLLSWCIALLGLFAWLKLSAGKGDASAPPAPPGTYLKALAYLILGSGLSSILLYSNYLQNPLGLLDALRSFFIYEPTLGHEKPAYDYAWRLLWPKPLAGLWWTEIMVLLGAAGAFYFSPRYSKQQAACCFLAIAGIAHFAIYSAIGYKTPWLMLLPWAHFCLLAGCLALRFSSVGPRSRLAILLLAILGLGYQTKQCLAATGRMENHERNPYVYVPTSHNVEALADWLQALNALQPLATIAVVGQEYWPLPWYLRRLDAEIHFWPRAEAAELQAYAVVLAMPAERSAVQRQLGGSHIEHSRSLRLNVPLFMFLDENIWNRWIRNDANSQDP